MEEARIKRIEDTVSNRQLDLTVVLENVHDPHNISAVLRTCDSVGIREIFVLYSDSTPVEKLELGKKSSAGARKWVDIHFYQDTKACFEHIKSKYDKIYSTHLSKDASSVYDLELTQSVALLFGNEHEGCSEEALSYSDGNFIIPQHGMVRSLNISVACAISLYEAQRQRLLKNKYNIGKEAWTEGHHKLNEVYLERSLLRIDPEFSEKIK